MKKLFGLLVVLGSVFGSTAAQAQDPEPLQELDMSVQMFGPAYVDADLLQRIITDDAAALLGDDHLIVVVVPHRQHRLTTLDILVMSERITDGNVYTLRQLIQLATCRDDITVPTVDGRPWRRARIASR